MRLVAALVSSFLLAACGSVSSAPPAAYTLVQLKTGSHTPASKEEGQKIFAGHFDNIGRLAEEGKLVVAGPFGTNDRAYRGPYIFNVTTVQEAEKLVILDPAVKSCVFVHELTP
jgi:uncharacterized protein YciI